MNWLAITISAVVLIALLVFLNRRNLKDKQKFEKDLNQDYPHSTDNPTDVDLENL